MTRAIVVPGCPGGISRSPPFPFPHECQWIEIEERPVCWADGPSTGACGCTYPGRGQGKGGSLFSCANMWLFACKRVQWEGTHTCVSQTPGICYKRDCSLHWKADMVLSPSSFGKLVQSCWVLRKTGSGFVCLKASGCKLQKDFPSSSATGTGQRAGGAM